MPGRQEINRSAWPDEGPYRVLLEFFERVRKENGTKGLRPIAKAMQLSSHDRVNRILRGQANPADEDQLKNLVKALGGSSEDVERGVQLYRAATGRSEGDGRNKAEPAWWSRCAYPSFVRGFIPDGGLLDRDQELAELARFCDGKAPYMRWQAEPWAGKTALMSTFVRNPPPGLDVVSFFVTARLTAYADSTGFVTALAEQLTAVAGTSPSQPVTRQWGHHYLEPLWVAAAERAARNGRRLALVVDGLDEDRGAVAGTGLPSIASLLPRIPDLRVIVASRPAPPLPDDVDDGHPLRASEIRSLAVSPYAESKGDRARQELNELLTGGSAHQELIGVVSASGGGLTLNDLEELTGRAPFELDRAIRGVCGRTIAARRGHMADEQREILWFTHDTLRIEAVNRLGRFALERCLERIHAWSDGYRRKQWPVETPSYLLHDYPRMLAAERDFERLRMLATDTARHDRMLDVTGGDATAFAEITAAQDLQLSAPTPDLLALARLAIHRDTLAHRNENVPANLPVVWGILGQLNRAEALACGITDPDTRTSALIEVVEELASAGHQERAARLAKTAETAAHTIDRPGRRAHVLMSVSTIMAAIDDRERAKHMLDGVRNIIDGLRDPRDNRRALIAALAQAAASQGDIDRARALARELTTATTAGGEELPPRVVVPLVEVLTAAGDLNGAERIALAITSQHDFGMSRLDALATVAKARLLEGDRERFSALAEQIILCDFGRPTDDFGNSYHVGAALASLSAAAAASKWYAQAENLVGKITDQEWRARALASLAKTLATSDDKNWSAVAARFLGEAEELVRALPDWDWKLDKPLSALAEAFAAHGDYDRAERTAEEISWPYSRGSAMAATARAAAARGDQDQARMIARKAEEHARAAIDAYRDIAALAAFLMACNAYGNLSRTAELAAAAETRALAQLEGNDSNHSRVKLGMALVAAGHYRRAEPVANAIDVPGQRADVLRAVLPAATASGDVDYAVSLAQTAAEIQPTFRAVTDAALGAALAAAGHFDHAESLARTVSDHSWQSAILLALVRSLAAAQELDRGTELAAKIGLRSQRAEAYKALMEAAALQGQFDRVASLANDLGDPQSRTWALTATVQSRAEAGTEAASTLISLAESHARSISDPADRAGALTMVAEALTIVGSHEQGAAMATEALTALGTGHLPYQHARALAVLVDSVVAAGDRKRAEQVAAEAEAIAVAYRSLPPPLGDFGARDLRPEVQKILARAIAATGRTDRAVVVINGLQDGHERATALQELIEWCAANSKRESAEAIVRETVEEERRVPALISLATGAFAAGDMDSARRHIATVLADSSTTTFGISNWTQVLDLLGRADPQALDIVAGEYLARLSPHLRSK
ncbi:hypothetical protein [Streptomyces europaeiscabiei]|uniref:hypothetical protein n=1 Tax=Streptomyces europaeiscabiei TaxID=146819 RepID=UPI0029ABFBD0|nr:hypothetical protein [Streptomyces europaeiscabiei]MDX2758400.1 hypothetical protein [Streptomyces europaeiscabiei]